jgi:hypothetical protein
MPGHGQASCRPSGGGSTAGEDGWASHALGLAGLLAYLVVFFVLLEWHYPKVGHDYRFVFAMLFEDAWSFIHGGLAIPRYAVHLCGGSVLYGHPLDMFYSPVHLLSWLTDPWTAVRLVMLAAFVIGYVGWYRLGRDLLRLAKAWSHVLALVVLANGFHFMHLLAGHFTYHGFPLIGWLLWLLFEQNPDAGRAHIAKRAIIFGLFCAYLLYSGNWAVLFFLPFLCLLLLPLDLFAYSASRHRLRELGVRACVFALAALPLMASKLVAVWSLVRHFPRILPLEVQDPARSTLGYVFRALWVIPQNEKLLDDIQGYVHERSMLLSPITLLGLAIGMVLLVRSLQERTGLARVRLSLFAVLYGGATLITMVQLVSGHGWLADVLHRLPLGSSQHVSSRYLYPFSLLLSAAAVWALAVSLGRWRCRWRMVGMALATSATVAGFAGGYAKMLPEVGLFENVDDYRALWEKLETAPPVTAVVQNVDFFAGSVKDCYEPILNAGGNPSAVLHLGSVRDQDHGYFNLMNPACYQYPEQNDCAPGDRIRQSDGDNLDRLTHGRPVTWRVSAAQQIADLLSALSFVAVAAVAAYLQVQGRRRGV